MPRVNHVKRARKDQGKCGKCGDPLLVGRPYRFWKFRYGSKRKRCMKPECNPRRSDLTQSKLGVIYDAQDDAQEILGKWGREDVSELRDALENLAGTVREVSEEYAEAAEPFGNAGENQERADELESWADEIESKASELEDYEDQDCETCGGDGVEDAEDGKGKVACSNEDCKDGKVKRNEEWADEIEEEFNEAVEGCPL